MSSSTVSLGPRTSALLERLRRVDPAAGDVDRGRAARAAALLLERLGLPARPPRWAEDGPSFFGEILSAGWTLHLGSSSEPGPLKVAHRSQVLSRLSPRVQNELRDPAFQAALTGLLSRPHECRHGQPPREPSPAAAAGAAAADALKNLPAFGGSSALWEASADGARRLLRTAGIPEGGPDHFYALEALTQIGATLNYQPAGLAGLYLADLAASESAGVAGSLAALEPMIDALESGLWHFWPTATETLMVSRPAMRFVGGRLHDEKQAAVSWPSGTSYHFLFNVPVARDVVEAPATLDPARIERETLPYRRGILIQQYGLDRYLRDARGEVVAESPAGRLIRFESFALVEIRRTAGLPAEVVRVPATVATPEEGLAWTFGLTAAEHALDKDVPYRELYSPREMGPEARTLIERLRRVDRKNPVVDRAKAAAAFARRFPSVAAGKTKIDWMTGREAASLGYDQFCKGHSLEDDERTVSTAESIGETEHAAGLACNLEAEQAALDALEDASSQYAVSREACAAVGVAAARHLGRISLGDEEFARFWLPWVDLYEAGAAALWTEPGAIHVVQRPAMRIVDGVLDDDGDPAVAWPEGPTFRFRRGVRLQS